MGYLAAENNSTGRSAVCTYDFGVRRPHRIQVRLSDDERTALKAAASTRGVSRADVLRAGIEAAPRLADVPTREEVLATLRDRAQTSVTALIALERALRLAPPTQRLPAGPVSLDELRRTGELKAVP
jgi:uncharacterized protein (DUF1778 family)